MVVYYKIIIAKIVCHILCLNQLHMTSPKIISICLILVSQDITGYEINDGNGTMKRFIFVNVSETVPMCSLTILLRSCVVFQSYSSVSAWFWKVCRVTRTAKWPVMVKQLAPHLVTLQQLCVACTTKGIILWQLNVKVVLFHKSP